MSEVPRTSRARSPVLRRAGVLAASLAVGLLLAEAGTRGFLRARGEAWDAAAARRDVETILEGMIGVAEGVRLDPREPQGPTGEARKKPAYELHPYLGYLPPMGFERIDEAAATFVGAEHEDRYDVFLFGGSVAAGFRGAGMDALLEGLTTTPEIRGRPVRFQSFAVPGYKQPQQLLLLSYLISRGCRPDLVLNLDGLNELRIPAGNAVRGLEPTFPSVGNWAMVAGSANESTATLDAMLAVRAIQARAASFGRRALGGGWFRSAVAGRWALSRMRRERASWAAAVKALEGRLAEGLQEVRPVPRDERPDPEAVLDDAIACWFESSLAMHALCVARGARYVHLLQPTLHDEGSKPVSPKEQEIGIGARGLDDAVVAGYPRLRAGIARLAERGVEALDTSDAFVDVAETLYVDSCHLNGLGNRLLAARAAALMGLAAEED